MKLLPWGDGDSNPVCQSFFTQIRCPRPGEDDHLNRTIARMDPQAIASKETDRSYVTTLEIVVLDCLGNSVDKFRFLKRNFETINCGGCVEALYVSIESKYSGTVARLVTTNSFKHPRTIVKPMRRHMYTGIGPLN